MLLNRAYIKINKPKDEIIVKDMIYNIFKTEEIEMETVDHFILLSVYEQEGFQIKLENIINSLIQDCNIEINVLIVPFFAVVFEKYLDYYKNQVHTAFSIFVKLQKYDFVLEDCKKIVSMFSKKDIDTIKAFLKCNCNVCVTANELYLHRNSLNYRINQFILNTGIDIRDYNSMCFLNLIFNIID